MEIYSGHWKLFLGKCTDWKHFGMQQGFKKEIYILRNITHNGLTIGIHSDSRSLDSTSAITVWNYRYTLNHLHKLKSIATCRQGRIWTWDEAILSFTNIPPMLRDPSSAVQQAFWADLEENNTRFINKNLEVVENIYQAICSSFSCLSWKIWLKIFTLSIKKREAIEI